MYVIGHFSLVAFNSLSRSLIFVSLITMCLSMSSLSSSFLRLSVLPGLVDYFLSHVREISSYYFFIYFLKSFLSLFSFWEPYKVNIRLFNVVRKVS